MHPVEFSLDCAACAGIQGSGECNELGGRLCIVELLFADAIPVLPHSFLEGAGTRQQGGCALVITILYLIPRWPPVKVLQRVCDVISSAPSTATNDVMCTFAQVSSHCWSWV